MKKLFQKATNFIKSLFKQLKDKTNIAIFIIVFLVLSVEVWLPIILGLITGNAWWYGIATACWGFWLAPFTPFIPLCFVITFTIRKFFNFIKKRKNKQL